MAPHHSTTPMASDKQVPLLDRAAESDGVARARAACINLVATTIGTGILSVPISLSYCGLAPGLAILAFFAILSSASLRFLSAAAALVHASSYAAIGERVFGTLGRELVLWSLLLLLAGASIQVHICITDLVEMLAERLLDQDIERDFLSAAITLIVTPLCMPIELHSLRHLSSASVLAILFTTGCIVTRCIVGGSHNDTAVASSSSTAPWLLATPLSVRWSLAMPIHSLAYCNQFQILDLESELPAGQRRFLPLIIAIAMGAACAVYALVGAAGYILLGSETANYPNILTAFGYDEVVLFGSSAILLVNVLKMPLVILPLRSLLVERLGIGSMPSPWAHVLFTIGLVVLVGAAAMQCRDLAFAFQVSGCTAGVMVCFCLPGLLYFGAHRLARRRGALLQLASEGLPSSSDARRTMLPASRYEVAGLVMLMVGALSGALCLYVLLGMASDEARA